jgi:hypothetical protein
MTNYGKIEDQTIINARGKKNKMKGKLWTTNEWASKWIKERNKKNKRFPNGRNYELCNLNLKEKHKIDSIKQNIYEK